MILFVINNVNTRANGNVKLQILAPIHQVNPLTKSRTTGSINRANAQ